MNRELKKDLKLFLETYLKFKINNNETDDTKLVLQGGIDIIDDNLQFWDSYKIEIIVPKIGFPNVVPLVVETSEKIKRDEDYHISEEGLCCLDIPHKLLIEKSRGISLVNFYQNYIYPFFANHQYKLKTTKYAGEEYKHYSKGIIQFYEEEYGLTDTLQIIQYLEFILEHRKAERNKECPICGKPKYKKCCRLLIESIKRYGKKQLQIDLDVFKSKLEKQI